MPYNPTPVTDYIKDLRKLSVGVGSEAVKADRSGLWAGGNKFADAPFSIDMQGNMYSRSPSGNMVRDTVNVRDIIYDENGIPVILIGRHVGRF